MVSIIAFCGISGANFNPCSLSCPQHQRKHGVEGSGNLQRSAARGRHHCRLLLPRTLRKSLQSWPCKGYQLCIRRGLRGPLHVHALLVVLDVAAVKKGCQQWVGLAIGFVIVAGAYGAGAVSGGCLNPAVVFGIDVSSSHLSFGACLVYTACELIGAALAAGLFKVVRPMVARKMRSTRSAPSSLPSSSVPTFWHSRSA